MKNKQKHKKSLVRRFLKIVFIMVGVFVLAFSALVYGFNRMFGEDGASDAVAKALGSNLKRGGSILDVFDSVAERTNFVLLGVDGDATRTDFMMVGCFNSKTKSIDLISVPRDTYAVIPAERRAVLKEHGRSCPSYMKLNEVHAYAGKELGTEFIVKQLEDILNIKIQYYVKVDLDAFKYVVDEVLQGVEFDVPQRMYYNDPEQGLYIDLLPGLQTLNGAQAEGLVRYRKQDKNNPISPGYAMGDLKRVEVQQDFMKAVISQALAKDALLSNAPELFSAAVKYVKTNLSAADLMKYLAAVKGLDSQNIQTHTIPWVFEQIGGTNWLTIDKTETAKLSDEIFYGIEQEVITP